MNYLTDFPVNYVNSSPNVILDLTYIASPTLVNEATIGYSARSGTRISRCPRAFSKKKRAAKVRLFSEFSNLAASPL